MTRKWDYKDARPNISEDFKDEFYLDIKKKTCVKATGLVVLAHEKGIKSLTTTILQFPNKDNGNMCIVQAHVVGYDWDAINNKIAEVEYSGIGDASPSNCTSMVSAAFIRMAETRAVGRCLGKYINIGMVTSEEMFDVVEVEPITKKQVQIIIDLKKKFAVPKKVGSDMLKRIGTDFSNLSKDQAYMFIDDLKQYGANHKDEADEEDDIEE